MVFAMGVLCGARLARNLHREPPEDAGGGTVCRHFMKAFLHQLDNLRPDIQGGEQLRLELLHNFSIRSHNTVH